MAEPAIRSTGTPTGVSRSIVSFLLRSAKLFSSDPFTDRKISLSQKKRFHMDRVKDIDLAVTLPVCKQ